MAKPKEKPATEHTDPVECAECAGVGKCYGCPTCGLYLPGTGPGPYGFGPKKLKAA